MSIDQIPEYTGEAPAIGQEQNEFNTNTKDQLDFFNQQAVNINTFATQANALGDSVEASEQNAASSAAAAASNANFAGNWSDATGVSSRPISYRHNGRNWQQLAETIPDITLNEPQENAFWTELSNVVITDIINPNLISNSGFGIAGSVVNPPDATPRSYSAGDELFAGMFAVGPSSGVTYVNGLLNGTGQLYTDVYKADKQKDSTSDFTPSVAGSNGNPYETGATVVDNGDYWRVTFDMTNTFSVKFEQGSVATGHEVDGVCDPLNIALYPSCTMANFIAACSTKNASISMSAGFYSNLDSVAELLDIDGVTLRGAGKEKTLFPKTFSIRIVGTESDCAFSGFGKIYTVSEQNLGNVLPLIQWRQSKGKFTLHDWAYIINATHPDAGGGGIAVQFFDGCEDSEIYDFKVQNVASAGVWSGRKFDPANNSCNYGEVYGGKFVLTINAGFPAGHNISECKSVYSHDNRYDGYKKRYTNRVIDTSDPNADNIKPLFHTETIQNTAGTQGWIASFPEEGDQGAYSWSPYSGVQNNAYGVYSGDHEDGATGLDAPDRFYSDNEYFEDCHRQIHVHNVREFVVNGVREKAGTNQEGIFFTGLQSVAPQQPFPDLVQVTDCSTPFVLFGKAKKAFISGISSTQSAGTANYPQIFAYPNNNPTGPRGGELVIGPCNLSEGRVSGMQIAGYDSVIIQAGYVIRNPNRTQKTDPNEGFGIGIIDGDCKYHSIGDGVIVDDDNYMTVGLNLWSVRKVKGAVSKQIDIRGYNDFSAGNDTGIYGAKVFGTPTNGQWQDPGFGYYTAGFETPLYDFVHDKYVAVTNAQYGRYELWDSAKTYAINEFVTWKGGEYESDSNGNLGNDPTSGTGWFFRKQIMKVCGVFSNP